MHCMLSSVRAIVFDLDGTLYSSGGLGYEIGASAYRYIAGVRKLSVDEAAALVRETKRRLTSLNGREASLSLVCLELGGDLRELHHHFAEDIDPERFLTRDERVIDLLHDLDRQHELYLYTNNNRLLTARIMDVIGVSGFFEKEFTIEDYWRPKPDRPTLDAIFREIGRQPAECLFVGDRYDIDLRLPAELGCPVFLTSSVEELLTLNSCISKEQQ